MNSVYALYWSEAYEGQKLVGVYSTYSKANAQREAMTYPFDYRVTEVRLDANQKWELTKEWK